MWAGQMLSALHRWLLDREIVVMGDGAYNCLALGWQAAKRSVTLITPGQLDHAFHDPLLPVEHRPKGGKPRIMGMRQPNLDQVLSDPTMLWQDSEIQWCSGTAWGHRAKLPPLPIRWVLVRDPTGKHEPKAFLCTNRSW